MKLFVGFDMQNSNIRIMHAEKPAEPAAVDFLHFQSRIFSDEFFEETQKLLEEYFVKKPSLQNLPAYVILPDQAVGFETFNLPNMGRAKMQQALDTELNNEYEGRQKGKKINQFVLAQNKQYTTIGAVYFDKKLIAQIYKLLTDVRVFPRETTYSGNALLSGALNFAPRLRGKNFVFADMHLDYTEIAVSSKGRTLGFAVIPHGTSLLKTDKVELEYMQTNHEVGEIAVINAREMARAKALTLADEAVDPSVIPEGATIEDYAVETPPPAHADEGEEEADKAAAEGEAAGPAEGVEGRTAAEGTAAADSVTAPADGAAAGEGAEEAAGEGAPAGNAEGATAEGQGADDDFYESEEEEAKRLAEIAKEKLRKVKVYRKMPKRYPKFMMREPPVTEEGFLFENFRIIMKWILLYARQAELSEYTATPEFIVVNMPAELYGLLDRANEDMGEKGLQFRPFTAADKFSAEIKGNLNLYGCLFSKHFNKNHNF